MKGRRGAAAFTTVCAAAITFIAAIAMARAKANFPASDMVNPIRTPNGGLQPQAVTDASGALHLVYFAGEPGGGDIFYVRRGRGEVVFSSPIRVNSQPGSAIATGTIRGAHIAVGRIGRVHVSWNGSNQASPRGPENSAPMLYARMNDAKTAFEAQRNLMRCSHGLDGGGSLTAADQWRRIKMAPFMSPGTARAPRKAKSIAAYGSRVRPMTERRSRKRLRRSPTRQALAAVAGCALSSVRAARSTCFIAPRLTCPSAECFC